MFYIFFLLFILLLTGLLAPVLLSGPLKFWARIFRIAVLVSAVGTFTYYFITSSNPHFKSNSLTVQLINKLPLPLDFYVVKIQQGEAGEKVYVTTHTGSVRSGYYRLEYLDMKKSDEFWVAGYMGRKNMVYFSQHSIPNKNEDQIIEVQNYINQSQKLSEIAGNQIDVLKAENLKTAIYLILDLILIFLNIVMVLKPRK